MRMNKLLMKWVSVLAVVLVSFTGSAADTAENGKKDEVDNRPYIRIPFLTQKPILNDEMTEGKWDAAARITGFGNYNQGALSHLNEAMAEETENHNNRE